MSWPYRHIIIVSAEQRDMANQAASGIDPDTGGANTFGVPLSADGSEPATHYGCSMLSTEQMRQSMEGAQGVITSVKWWRLDPTTETLQATNTEHGTIGEILTRQQALDALGLSGVLEVVS